MIQTTKDYPEITYESVFALYTISQKMKQDKQYLDKAPYSEAIKKSLSLMFGKKENPQAIPQALIDTSDLDLKAETNYLYKEAKSLLKSTALDEKDRAAVIKTMTSQMDKLISLVERTENINQIREFETKVLRTIKKVLPEKREEFLAELAKLEDLDNDN